MRAQQVALLATGAIAALGLGYIIYFDYSRRSDPDFRKKLKRQRKQAAKAAQESQAEDKANKIKLIENVIVAAARETYPTSPEEREKYFMNQVAEGEALCTKGPEFYEQAVLPFYKALKVYPAPMELIVIYQKSIPEPVFTVIVNILAIEQQAMEASAGGAAGATAGSAPAEDEADIPIDN
ncbi:MAS20 protein import receptor-domain-containing protein [Dichotomocladium elegans]|nr:MAS20 protein import receptor-domain-containing protein [Dichotomocladium elegans]